jgi:predicted transposase YbfD/YdcC
MGLSSAPGAEPRRGRCEVQRDHRHPPLLLERLQLSGALVTIDAMGTQVKIAEIIVQRDYLLALKENRPVLYTDVETFFADPAAEGFETTDAGHGRIEQRRHVVRRHVEWLFSDRRYDHEPRFAHLAMIGIIQSNIQSAIARSCRSSATFSVQPA